MHIKNKNCKIHAIRTSKKNYKKNQQKKIKEKYISALGRRDLFCATKCVAMKESDVPLLKNHTINEKENEDDAKEKLNNKVNEAKNNPKKI